MTASGIYRASVAQHWAWRSTNVLQKLIYSPDTARLMNLFHSITDLIWHDLTATKPWRCHQNTTLAARNHSSAHGPAQHQYNYCTRFMSTYEARSGVPWLPWSVGGDRPGARTVRKGAVQSLPLVGGAAPGDHIVIAAVPSHVRRTWTSPWF